MLHQDCPYTECPYMEKIYCVQVLLVGDVFFTVAALLMAVASTANALIAGQHS